MSVAELVAWPAARYAIRTAGLQAGNHLAEARPASADACRVGSPPVLRGTDGGGAYAVGKKDLGAAVSLLAAASLVVDYVLTVAVSLAAGAASLASAFPPLAHHLLARVAGGRLPQGDHFSGQPGHERAGAAGCPGEQDAQAQVRERELQQEDPEFAGANDHCGLEREHDR
jgi:hypothetical protein